jgi:hypothetical protein
VDCGLLGCYTTSLEGAFQLLIERITSIFRVEVCSVYKTVRPHTPKNPSPDMAIVSAVGGHAARMGETRHRLHKNALIQKFEGKKRLRG